MASEAVSKLKNCSRFYYLTFSSKLYSQLISLIPIFSLLGGSFKVTFELVLCMISGVNIFQEVSSWLIGLGQWFPTRNEYASLGHLAVFRDIFDCHDGSAIGI
jgi:hypothetical protein